MTAHHFAATTTTAAGAAANGCIFQIQTFPPVLDGTGFIARQPGGCTHSRRGNLGRPSSQSWLQGGTWFFLDFEQLSGWLIHWLGMRFGGFLLGDLRDRRLVGYAGWLAGLTWWRSQRGGGASGWGRVEGRGQRVRSLVQENPLAASPLPIVQGEWLCSSLRGETKMVHSKLHSTQVGPHNMIHNSLSPLFLPYAASWVLPLPSHWYFLLQLGLLLVHCWL